MINIIYITKIFNIIYIIYILNIINIYFIKAFMLGISMQLDILTRLTSQLTTIICHHIKKHY